MIKPLSPIAFVVPAFFALVQLASAQTPGGPPAPPAAVPAPTAGANRGGPPSDAFCSNDPRPEVKAFCGQLSELLREVKAGKSLSDVRPVLVFLNPANPQAINTVIPVIVRQFAAKAALQTASQLSTDQQLGPGSTAAGTTSLVTKAEKRDADGARSRYRCAHPFGQRTTATLSSNADELFRLVTGYSPDCVINCKQTGVEAHLLNPLNFSGRLRWPNPALPTLPLRVSGVQR